MSVDKFFLTEIMLNSKNLHNLQHSQVRSKGDDDTCAPEINQQVLCHVAHKKLTKA